MSIFFQYAANDQSVAYLGNVFGAVGRVLPTTNTTIFAAIFSKLNTMALTIGAIIVIYTTIVGLLKTATEGEFLGRQWSSLWVPLRMVIGIGSLFPTAGGYSILQVFVMWVIIQGVGAADLIWETWIKTQSKIGAAGTQPSQGPKDTTINQQFQELFKGLLCQATMKRNDNIIKGNGSKIYYCAANPADPFCSKSNTEILNVLANKPVNHTIIYQMGPNGACGTVTFGDPAAPFIKQNPADQTNNNTNAPPPQPFTCPTTKTDVNSLKTCAIAQSMPLALQTVVSYLGTVADRIAFADAQYVNYYLNPPASSYPTTIDWLQDFCTNRPVADMCCLMQNPDISTCKSPTATGCHYTCDKAFPDNSDSFYSGMNQSEIPGNAGDNTKLYYFPINKIIGDNVDIITPSVATFQTALNAAIGTAMAQATLSPEDQWANEAISKGWLVAGAFYYRVAALNGTGASLGVLDPTQFSVSTSIPDQTSMPYRNNAEAATKVTTYMTSGTTTPGSAGQPPQVQQLNSMLDGTQSAISSGFFSVLGGSSSQDPLLRLASFGHYMLIVGQALYLYFLLLGAVAIGAGQFTTMMVLGSGMAGSFVTAFLGFLMNGLFLAVMLIVGLLFIYGGIFAVYLPLIPYFIFTFGVIGWFMATIEAMVAAPFVALGILSPGGEEIMGKATPSIGILFNVFLRPALMIVGLAFAMMLERFVVFPLINNTFSAVMGNISNSPSPAELFIFMAAYTFFIITVVNKCFSLIYEIPDRTLRWISFEARGYGEATSVEEATKQTRGVGETLGGGAKGTIGAMGGAVRDVATKAGQKGEKK